MQYPGEVACMIVGMTKISLEGQRFLLDGCEGGLCSIECTNTIFVEYLRE